MMAAELGLIEGFYGRSWAAADRLDSIAWLGGNSYKRYIFAPKEESRLRAQWLALFDDESMASLHLLTHAGMQHQVQIGVGLSPLNAVHCFDDNVKAKLLAKLQQLSSLKLHTLCVLFDDMHCAMPDLAARQLQIVDFIALHCSVKKIIVCPTYYSYDAVLERVFGVMPKNYWQDLGAGLDSSIDLFWTGNKVCSPTIGLQDIERACDDLGRVPVLWDNYPVNDGEKASKYLHVEAFQGRDPRLSSILPAHIVNPMNQCHLSRLALSTLPALYNDVNYNSVAACNAAQVSQLSFSMADVFAEDTTLFHQQGLDEIDEAQRLRLIEKYNRFAVAGEPAAIELCDWLNDGYKFDPACLTEE